MNEAGGIAHFLGQTDGIGKGLFVILVLMSMLSWFYIISRTLLQIRMKKRSRIFLDFFWNAPSLDAVQHEIKTHGIDNPFSNLTSHALVTQAHRATIGVARLEEAGSAADFLTRTMRRVIDEETTRLENGLTVLASVGATAPFVGLFGTVWGVYHALLAIGAGGMASLEQIAGPVGEALIMTGLGLAVAIPAVLGYNALVRSNRVLLGRLDSFAHDLFAFLTTGQPAIIGSGKNAALSPLRDSDKAAGN